MMDTLTALLRALLAEPTDTLELCEEDVGLRITWRRTPPAPEMRVKYDRYAGHRDLTDALGLMVLTLQEAGHLPTITGIAVGDSENP